MREDEWSGIGTGHKEKGGPPIERVTKIRRDDRSSMDLPLVHTQDESIPLSHALNRLLRPSDSLSSESVVVCPSLILPTLESVQFRNVHINFLDILHTARVLLSMNQIRLPPIALWFHQQ